MYVQRTGYVHSPQPISSPHRAAAPKPATDAPAGGSADRVEFSSQADFVSKARDLPDIRADKVADLKRQIAAGSYDTDDRLDAALERMLDEIGAW